MPARKEFFYDGEYRYLKEISRITEVPYVTLCLRIRKGMTLEAALSTPIKELNHPAWVKGTKVCTGCKVEKPLSDFVRLSRRSGNEFCPRCMICDREQKREYRRSERERIISAYSNGNNCCEICGESRIEVLDLDHINGGGIQHRKQFKTPQAYYKSIRDAGYPPGFRILCRNCNWIEHLKLHKQGKYHV